MLQLAFIVPNGIKSALVLVMPLSLTGDKAITWANKNEYICRQIALLSYNELI